MIEREVRGVDYPTSDGRPMAETDTHRNQMVDLIHTLQGWYASRDDVYVSGNLLLYYVKGNKRRHVSPDVFVVKDIHNRERDYYLLWEEGQPPHMVIEITSSSTRHQDMHRKKELYAALGVREYFVFDPLRDYLKPQLRGWRLSCGRWIPIHGRSLHSEVVGLDLRIVDNRLRLVDPTSGTMLPTRAEMAQAAGARAEAAEARAEAAEALADEERRTCLRLEGELERLRAALERGTGSAAE